MAKSMNIIHNAMGLIYSVEKGTQTLEYCPLLSVCAIVFFTLLLNFTYLFNVCMCLPCACVHMLVCTTEYVWKQKKFVGVSSLILHMFWGSNSDNQDLIANTFTH